MTIAPDRQSTRPGNRPDRAIDQTGNRPDRQSTRPAIDQTGNWSVARSVARPVSGAVARSRTGAGHWHVESHGCKRGSPTGQNDRS